MFEGLVDAAGRAAEARSKATIAALAERLRTEAAVDVAADEEGVRLAGPGLKRRFLLDPALRWFTARLR